MRKLELPRSIHLHSIVLGNRKIDTQRTLTLHALQRIKVTMYRYRRELNVVRDEQRFERSSFVISCAPCIAAPRSLDTRTQGRLRLAVQHRLPFVAQSERQFQYIRQRHNSIDTTVPVQQ
ncbi:hypothetical protein BSE24067_04375 [Burkholderia seminalis]|nr:hypothetical protein BSE24067_04375 [Burkholderia seminalis]